MTTQQDLLDKVFSAYHYQGSVIVQPSFDSHFYMDKPRVEGRLPFHFLQQGNCHFHHQGEDYLLEEGDLVVLMHGDAHTVQPQSQARFPTTFICGYFECATPYTQTLAGSFPDVVIIKHTDIAQSAKMQLILAALVDEVNNGQLGATTAINSLTNIFFVYLLRQLLEKEVKCGLLAGLSDRYLSKAFKAFHQGFHEQWTIERLAECAGLSRTKFIARFSEIVGVSPGAYIKEWRLNWAATQLLDTSDSIYEIAIRAGYLSNAAFCRVFKQQFQLSPSQYRKQQVA